MNINIRKYIYIISAVCIVILIGVILKYILPVILIVGIIAYAAIKIRRFINIKKKEKEINNYKSDENQYNYQTPTEDYTNGEIIDVEYEEVDNEKISS